MKAFTAVALTAALASATNQDYRLPRSSYRSDYPNYGYDSLDYGSGYNRGGVFDLDYKSPDDFGYNVVTKQVVRPSYDLGYETDPIRDDILGAYYSVQDDNREPAYYYSSSHSSHSSDHSTEDGAIILKELEVLNDDGEKEMVSVVLPNTQSEAYLDKLRRQNPTAFVDFAIPASHIGDATTGEHVKTASPDSHYYAEPKECKICHEFADRIEQLEAELAYLRGARSAYSYDDRSGYKSRRDAIRSSVLGAYSSASRY